MVEGLDQVLSQQEQKRLATEPTSNEVTLAKVVYIDDNQQSKTSAEQNKSNDHDQEETVAMHKLLESPKKAERITVTKKTEEGRCNNFLCKWCCCCFCCGLCKKKKK